MAAVEIHLADKRSCEKSERHSASDTKEKSCHFEETY
jgi:hypothetical protein